MLDNQIDTSQGVDRDAIASIGADATVQIGRNATACHCRYGTALQGVAARIIDGKAKPHVSEPNEAHG